ncbi:MAG: hypothetical protein L6425_03785 [Candidatus Aminicenantes bacterium]|nr:hypothetical protein [Candidatus Aminicenantes bacterium]
MQPATGSGHISLTDRKCPYNVEIERTEKIMKYPKIIISLFFIGSLLGAQDQTHLATVINIEVPARVYNHGKFVENLSIDDFIIREDGIPQKIEAMYFIKKTRIEREEAEVTKMPITSRHYYFFFQITKYNPKINDVFQHFFTKTLLPEDKVTIITPMNKVLNLTKKALESKPRHEIATDLHNILRKHTEISGSEYRKIKQDLKNATNRIATSVIGPYEGQTSAIEDDSFMAASGMGIAYNLENYRNKLDQLNSMRVFSQKSLIQFAESIKKQNDTSTVFFFYEREIKPDLNLRILNRILSLYQDDPKIMSDVNDIFMAYNQIKPIDEKMLEKVYADSNVLFNFIYIGVHSTDIGTSRVRGKEHSEDIFSAFSTIAEATGGVTTTAQTPSAGFKEVLDGTETYYLLYYSPSNKNSKGNNDFRKIEVEIKDQKFTVKHRAGYFAR